MRRCNRKAVLQRPESQQAQHVRNVQIIGAMPVDSALSAPYHPRSSLAQVAELVDALASGASSRKGVEVRVFSWAPSSFTRCDE